MVIVRLRLGPLAGPGVLSGRRARAAADTPPAEASRGGRSGLAQGLFLLPGAQLPLVLGNLAEVLAPVFAGQLRISPDPRPGLLVSDRDVRCDAEAAARGDRHHEMNRGDVEDVGEGQQLLDAHGGAAPVLEG